MLAGPRFGRYGLEVVPAARRKVCPAACLHDRGRGGPRPTAGQARSARSRGHRPTVATYSAPLTCRLLAAPAKAARPGLRPQRASRRPPEARPTGRGWFGTPGRARERSLRPRRCVARAPLVREPQCRAQPFDRRLERADAQQHRLKPAALRAHRALQLLRRRAGRARRGGAARAASGVARAAQLARRTATPRAGPSLRAARRAHLTLLGRDDARRATSAARARLLARAAAPRAQRRVRALGVGKQLREGRAPCQLLRTELGHGQGAGALLRTGGARARAARARWPRAGERGQRAARQRARAGGARRARTSALSDGCHARASSLCSELARSVRFAWYACAKRAL